MDGMEGAVAEVISPEPIEETTVDSSAETVETEPTQESTDSDSTTPETPEVSDSQQNGVSPAVKNYIKQLKGSDPKAAQELERAVFGWNQFRTTYPDGIKGVQKLASIVDSIGGEEGLQALESERAEWAALDEKFTAGDPAFVTAIAESDPNAFAAIVPHALTHFAKTNPELYSHLMAGVVTNTVQPIAAELYQALAGDEKYKALAQKLATWFNGLDEQAKTRPQPKVDPEREKLTREREEFENQKVQAIHDSVKTELSGFNASLVESLLAKEYAKNGSNWQQFKAKSPDSAKVLIYNCLTELGRISDPKNDLDKSYRAYIQAGQKDRAVRLLKSRMEEFAPKAVQRMSRAFGGFSSGKPKPTTELNGNGQQPQGERQLPQMPDRKDIDWSRTTNDMILSGKAFLKNQKQMVRFA